MTLFDMPEGGFTQEQKGRTRIINLTAYFDHMTANKAVFVCHFLPDGTITHINHACKQALGGDVGQNFIPMLPGHEQKRVMRHLKTYTLSTPIRSHIEDIGNLKVRWINRITFRDDDSIIEFESVGWIVQTDKIPGPQKSDMLITV